MIYCGYYIMSVDSGFADGSWPEIFLFFILVIPLSYLGGSLYYYSILNEDSGERAIFSRSETAARWQYVYLFTIHWNGTASSSTSISAHFWAWFYLFCAWCCNWLTSSLSISFSKKCWSCIQGRDTNREKLAFRLIIDNSFWILSFARDLAKRLEVWLKTVSSVNKRSAWYIWRVSIQFYAWDVIKRGETKG